MSEIEVISALSACTSIRQLVQTANCIETMQGMSWDAWRFFSVRQERIKHLARMERTISPVFDPIPGETWPVGRV